MARLTIAERFLLCRKRMRLTQLELAQILRVSRKTISTVETGKRVLQSTLDRFYILEKRQRSVRQDKRRSGSAKVSRSLARSSSVAIPAGTEPGDD